MADAWLVWEESTNCKIAIKVKFSQSQDTFIRDDMKNLNII